MRFLTLVKSEIEKQRRGFIWWMIFGIPLGTTGAMFLDMYLRYQDYLYKRASNIGLTSWEMLLLENHQVLGWGIFLPIFIAVVCAIVYNTEYSGKAMKMVMSFPVSKLSLYTSKYAAIMLFSFIMIGLNSLGLIVVGKIIGFPEAVDYLAFGKYVLYQCTSVLGAAAIHHWISSYFDNAVVSVLVSLFGLFASIILKYDISRFLPYTYPTYALPLKGYFNTDCLALGAASAILLLFLGFLEFRKRDII